MEALEVLDPIVGVSTVTFSAADVVRHRLVGEIVAAYDKAGQDRARQERTRER